MVEKNEIAEYEKKIAKAIDRGDVDLFIYYLINNANNEYPDKLKLLTLSRKQQKILMYKESLHNEYVNPRKRKKYVHRLIKKGIL